MKLLTCNSDDKDTIIFHKTQKLAVNIHRIFIYLTLPDKVELNICIL